MSTPAAQEFQALSETVFHWSMYDPGCKTEIGCTALNLEGRLVVFDPVPLADEAWEELLAIAPLSAILLTSGNHVRNTPALKQKYKVPVATAIETRRELGDLKADVVLLPNELLYGLTAIPIPGATKGETAFYAPEGVMILGDSVINTSTETGLEFLPDKYCVDAKQNKASVRQLLNYNFHTLMLAHGTPVTTHAKEKLSALLRKSA